jgi:hypothetical protein
MRGARSGNGWLRALAKPSRIDRLQKMLLNNALRFCRAEVKVQLARRQWKELHDLHDPESRICCLSSVSPMDEQDGREALPKSQWCEHCQRITSEAISYYDALWERRAAKVGMRRAYKLLCARNSTFK